jgi:hypothetical protein
MSALPVPDAIRAVYAQVDAPDWAAANLDGLLDVLRDLSWLPAGAVQIDVPQVEGPDAERFAAALRQAELDTADGPRPVRVTD